MQLVLHMNFSASPCRDIWLIVGCLWGRIICCKWRRRNVTPRERERADLIILRIAGIIARETAVARDAGALLRALENATLSLRV